ncbi:MAG: PadR family transcriptional regulator [Chloroflexota bacterium]
MAIEHAVLGLLAIEPRHGYELSKEFAQGTVLGDIVHLEPGMLYAHLKKLEREGWVEASIEPQDSRPPRRILQPTSTGHQEIQRWLTEPVDKTREIRLEFLLKLYLARQLRPEAAEQLIEQQRTLCDGFIKSLESQLETEEDEFHRLVLEMRLVQNQALARWLDQTARKMTPGAV